ncbi:MAG: formylglycine-generating enzyme family protein [Acetobacteraceae bacterium]|nr:formylglycine-generating enzyme family protein [Acetobacteraceae bacterium]MSP30181.1 formylglycine-generating enzyme family protein [Acetobacteraceae bacterium]
MGVLARAGSATAYSFGDDASQLGRYAWFGANSGPRTHPVGEKLSNKFGLHDMHGNVWEWVQDCWTRNYVNALTDGSGVVQQNDCDRVYRGGSWSDIPVLLRSADRNGLFPGNRFDSLGFGLARTLP